MRALRSDESMCCCIETRIHTHTHTYTYTYNAFSILGNAESFPDPPFPQLLLLLLLFGSFLSFGYGDGKGQKKFHGPRSG